MHVVLGTVVIKKGLVVVLTIKILSHSLLSCTQLLLSVLHNHGGSVVPAVHYLMAVLGDTGELPVSEDIGGLPQVLPDEEISDPETPTDTVVVELEDHDIGGKNPSTEECPDLLNPDLSKDSLPTYRDVIASPPPSYDSLHIPCSCASPVGLSATPSSPSVDEGMTNIHYSPHTPVDSLVRRLRIRRRERKGYQSHGTGSTNH